MIVSVPDALTLLQIVVGSTYRCRLEKDGAFVIEDVEGKDSIMVIVPGSPIYFDHGEESTYLPNGSDKSYFTEDGRVYFDDEMLRGLPTFLAEVTDNWQSGPV